MTRVDMADDGSIDMGENSMNTHKFINSLNPSIVTIGTMKTVKTFFFTFPALNSTAMNKKLKYSNSYRHKM